MANPLICINHKTSEYLIHLHCCPLPIGSNKIKESEMKLHTMGAALLAAMLLVACGKSEPPAASQSEPAAAQAAPAPQAVSNMQHAGESPYKKTCSMCHASGAAGAPIIGNKGDWEPRIAAGKVQLYQHAIAGFAGEKGMMPAKGGNATLSDDEVKAAVDYMLSKL